MENAAIGFQSGTMLRTVKTVWVRNIWRKITPKIKSCWHILLQITRLCFYFFISLYFVGIFLLYQISTKEIADGWTRFPFHMASHLWQYLLRNFAG